VDTILEGKYEGFAEDWSEKNLFKACCAVVLSFVVSIINFLSLAEPRAREAEPREAEPREAEPREAEPREAPAPAALPDGVDRAEAKEGSIAV
jgi:hypothetical protein